MPELPEVETTINFLKKKVLNRTFLDVWTDFPKMIKAPSTFEEFKKELKNKKIKNILRIGKNIIFELSNDKVLLIHQKLTGHLLYGVWEKKGNSWEAKEKGPIAEDPMNKFLHLIFWLDNGKQIALSDVRKFAKVELRKSEDLKEELKNLGPDPLKISFKEFEKIIRSRKGRIKQVLMNQDVIAGIGNIYSDEVLFASKIHPLREISSLKTEDLKRIYQSMKRILKKAIECQGTSIIDYRTPSGEKGEFEKLRKVYRREGEKCTRCASIIKRIKIGARSSCFCPKCQK